MFILDQTFKKAYRYVRDHRLLMFLMALVVPMLTAPLLPSDWTSTFGILEIAFAFILLSGIYLLSPNRRLLLIASLIALIAIILNLFNIILANRELMLTALFVEIVFFGISTITIIRHVLSERRVSNDKIYGAICGYLLLGLIWALIYTALENAQPGSFRFHFEPLITSPFDYTYPIYLGEFVYYSFVTLTTLGYGDVIPLNHTARALSSIESVTGQLYIAVLIARLVGLQITHSIMAERNPDVKNRARRKTDNET